MKHILRHHLLLSICFVITSLQCAPLLLAQRRTHAKRHVRKKITQEKKQFPTRKREAKSVSGRLKSIQVTAILTFSVLSAYQAYASRQDIKRLRQEVDALKSPVQATEAKLQVLQAEFKSFKEKAETCSNLHSQAFSQARNDYQRAKKKQSQAVKSNIQPLQDKVETFSHTLDFKAKRSSNEELTKKFTSKRNVFNMLYEAREKNARLKCEKKALKALHASNEVRNVQLKKLNDKLEQYFTEEAKQGTSVARLKVLDSALQAVLNKKRKLFNGLKNDIQELKGAIRVAVRCRPLSQKEIKASDPSVVTVENGEIWVDMTNVASYDKRKTQLCAFKDFNDVFNGQSNQSDIFNAIGPYVENAFDGYRAAILAYGQTGSGKTYTMIGEGEEEGRGIIPRTFDMIKKKAQSAQDTDEVKIEASFMEIYQNKVYDLSLPNKAEKQKKVQSQVNFANGFVKGITTVTLDKYEDITGLLVHLNHARKMRETSGTKMNASSSRSHLVIQIAISCKPKNTTVSASRGFLYLFDLAGNEKLKKSGVQGKAATEATAINLGLTVLGRVMRAIKNGDSYIPYRDSNLTMILKSCINQKIKSAINPNPKMFFIANISPAQSNAIESRDTLQTAYETGKVTLTQEERKNRRSISKGRGRARQKKNNPKPRHSISAEGSPVRLQKKVSRKNVSAELAKLHSIRLTEKA